MFRKFHSLCEPAGEKPGTGSAAVDSTEALIGKFKSMMDERFGAIEAKLGQKATSNMAGVEGATQEPSVITGKDLALDVEEGQEMNARMGWRIIDSYYQKAVARGLARGLDADDKRGTHEKEWAPRVRKALKSLHAAAPKGYLKLEKSVVGKAGQNISSFEEGGLWARETVSGEVIAYLREDSLMLNLPGFRRMTGYGTSLLINRQKTAPSAEWVGEGKPATASKVTWDEVRLGAHKMSGLTTISNDLLRLANGAAAAMAGDQLRIVMTELVDLALINGSGSGKPNGVYTLTDASHKVTVSGTDSAQTRVTDMSKLKKLVRKAFIPAAGKGVYLFSTDDFYALKDMRTPEGYVFPTLREANPTLNGCPVFESTLLEGIGTDSKNILGYGVPQHLILGESAPMEFEVGENGEDFKNDECSVRGIGYLDSGILYRKSWSFFTNAKYA